MMKKLLIIPIVLFLFGFQMEAQLLEDTQSRLKTAKVKSQGFLFFRSKKKVKTAPGAHRQKVIGQTSPRYSQGRVSFRTKGIAPRYSSGSPFRKSQYKVIPRYSQGNPFRGSRYAVSPRYSSGGRPFKSSDYKIVPRYSRGNPFRGADYKVTPRYSRGNPFRGADYKVTPRYSRGNPFRGADYKVSPRYSRGNPFRGADYKVSPRYSQGMPFESFYFKVKPRYSNPKNRFVVNSTYRKLQRYYNPTADYRGTMKIKKRGPGDQHPSSNYHFAMRFSNPKIRKMFRKWNIFWVRVNGNKEDSKGVRASVRSPKFDKKEKDIWNN